MKKATVWGENTDVATQAAGDRGRQTKLDEIPLTDPSLVPDVFVTGWEPPEFIDGAVRLTGYALRQLGFASGVEKVVVARIVMTHAAYLNSLGVPMRRRTDSGQ